MWPFKPKLDEFGRSELHYAPRDGNVRVSEKLITGGADVNLADKSSKGSASAGPELNRKSPAVLCTTLAGLFLFCSNIIGQTFPPGAVVTPGAVELNGWSLTTDSFDSSDPNYSTNSSYDPAKAKDNGDVSACGGITNSIGVGVAHIFGHAHTWGTNAPWLGPSGGIGSALWQTTHTGIEPGWWLQDCNFTNVSIPFPDTRGFLSPTNGTLVTIRNNVYYTNSYDQILWGTLTPSLTNYYVVNSLSGQTIAIGANIVLALPNGLTMSGNDAITVSEGTNIWGGPYPPASLTVYSAGNSCLVGGNGVINEPGFASNFKIFCSQSVTSAVVNGTAFSGVLIEPSADLSLNGAGDSPCHFIGYVMARSVSVNGNWNVHYDESLFGTNSPETLVFDSVNRTSIGSVELEIKGPAGMSITIYSSPDLSNWSPLTTLPNPQGTLQFTDTGSIGLTSRFYKAVAH